MKPLFGNRPDVFEPIRKTVHSKIVIPAKAGIQAVNLFQKKVENLDPRFRGDDDLGYSDWHLAAKAGVTAFLLATTLSVCATMPLTYDPPQTMIVIDRVVDVRAEPVRSAGKYKYDPLQETQVREGEPVFVYEKRRGWARVECPEQMEFTHNNWWQGYPGWVRIKALTAELNRRKNIEPPVVFDDTLRKKILDAALRHAGEAYLWGGRSLHDPFYKKTATGVDCSGLVNLSYREVGWLVPRDAHEQYLKSRRIEPSGLKTADLIFLAKADNPEKIVHVALFKDAQTLFEAPQSGERVREISFEKRFGADLSKLKNGFPVGDRVVYFGTFFPEKS